MRLEELAGMAESHSEEKHKKRGVHNLLKSAFKRGEAFGDHVAGVDSESRSSGKSSFSMHRGWKTRSEDSNSSSRRSDRSDEDFADFDGLRDPKVIHALRNAKVNHAYEPYYWEKKMKELLPLPESSCFLSLMILPKASNASNMHYNCLEDTLLRANTWLVSSQASGVPIVLMNVQTEALLTKITGETALSTVNMGSMSDLTNMANVSLYGFEDYHGVDIGVVRAVRLWYAPIYREMSLEIKLQLGDTRLGFAISRTEEGFIYISSVADENSIGVAACRSGLLELYREARRASKLLVVSRVGHEKVLPWMVSTAGEIKCFDTVSLSQKLSLHRHALQPIILHFLMWDQFHFTSVAKHTEAQSMPSLASEMTREVSRRFGNGDELGVLIRRDDGEDSSFRFQNIKLPDSWV